VTIDAERIEAFFVEATNGYRLYTRCGPPEATVERGTILYVHPFAEELNRTRRLVVQQARALAKLGWDVLLVDLLGCGDSSGDFADGRWEAWQTDVLQAYDWHRKRAGGESWLWGLRAGCLLASTAASSALEPVNLLLWQPVLSGSQHLQHFLRLKLANELAEEGGARRTVKALRDQLAATGAIEIAGYALSRGLATGLERAELAVPRAGTQTVWLEVSSREGPELSPAAVAHADLWRAQKVRVDTRVVSGPLFWQSKDILECPALISETCSALSSRSQ
jgi:exosortase A-associated hydrolase 2